MKKADKEVWRAITRGEIKPGRYLDANTKDVKTFKLKRDERSNMKELILARSNGAVTPDEILQVRSAVLTDAQQKQLALEAYNAREPIKLIFPHEFGEPVEMTALINSAQSAGEGLQISFVVNGLAM